MLIYHCELESEIAMKTPADYGGLASPDYRALNPQGKMPALLLASGAVLYEAKVIMGYIQDAFASKCNILRAATPEDRARVAIITQVHDLYIASPNSSDPSVTATQGCMYKGVDVIDGRARAAKVAELWKQLHELERLVCGPFAAGQTLTEADLTLWPTLACFVSFMMPKVFGWKDPMADATHFPKLTAWHAKVGALPAAARVKEEVMGALQGWEDSGRFEPIREQVAAHPDLKWSWP